MEQILARLDKVKKSGTGYTAICPVHDDNVNSLSVRQDGDKVLLHCHAGCEPKTVLNALGLDWNDLFLDDPKPPTQPTPATVYDYYGADGRIVYQVVRSVPKSFRQRRPDPDKPGQWIWNMQGVEPVPYRLPELTAALERHETVFIVEGERDVDNLAKIGLTATTNHGGADKWREGHSRHFPSGAEVVILPDNDKSGQQHGEEVSRQLRNRNCAVKVIELPDLPEKGDVSDWLAVGHGKDELLRLIDNQEEPQPFELPEPSSIDRIQNALKGQAYNIDSEGNLCAKVYAKESKSYVDVPVSNFVAWPIRQIIKDNGIDRTSKFEIEGLAEGNISLPSVTVPSDKFNNMNWPLENWGLLANIKPGSANKDKVRFVIQHLGRDAQRELIFGHLGWREINNKWVYLHAGGAVGGEGISVDVSDEGLRAYELPEPAEDIKAAVSCSLKTLDLAPMPVTIPLFALTYLAPLCEPLRMAGIEPAFIMWLSGVTGSMKSTVGALYLSHFGLFTGKSLPASFKDTANSLERRAFFAKDSLLVCDDYHPTASPIESSKMKDTAERLLRIYGDRVARGRLNSDATAKKSFVPKGLCLVTGEDHPDGGQSSAARYFGIELGKGEVNTRLLTELQADTKMLAQAMQGYIQSLDLKKLPAVLRDKFLSLREKATREGQHSRIPEMVSWLHIGLQAGLSYAVGVCALSKEERAKLLTEGWNILLELAEGQSRSIEGETPANKFLSVLSEMFTTKIAHTAAPDMWEATGGLGCLGWHDDVWYYLLPEITYKTVDQFYRAKGQHLPVGANVLWKHLDQEGLIFTQVQGKVTRRTVTKRIGKELKKVLQLKKSALMVEGEVSA